MANSAADAVKASDVVVLVLSDAAAIRSTLLEDPAAVAALLGKWILQMGTIGPEESTSIAADIEAAGGQYIEAPVLGSQPEVEKGTLQVMVGSKEPPNGTPAGVVLEAFCEEANYIGQVSAWPLFECAFSRAVRLIVAVSADVQEETLRRVQVGTAAAVKLALNQLIASLTVGFSTSLALLQVRSFSL